MKLSKSMLLCIILHIILLPQVKLDHTSFCIILPTLKYKEEDYLSAGMDKFPTQFWKNFEEELVNGELQDDLWQREDMNPVGYGINPRGNMNIYNIKRRNGEYLNGWFRIEIVLKPSDDNVDLHSSLKALILVVQDDLFRRQNIGEFVWNFPTSENSPNSCPKNDATKYMIISCAGASRTEPLVSNMVVLVRDNPEEDGGGKSLYPPETKDLRIIPKLQGRHSLNFYVRVPIQDCNQKKSFMFRARMIIDKKYYNPNAKRDPVRMLTTHIFVDAGAIPGIADPIPPPSQAKYLECGERITLPDKLPWYHSKVNPQFEDGLSHSLNALWHQTRFIHACQADLFVGRCHYHWYTLFGSLYNGLQSSLRKLREVANQNEAQVNSIPICEFKPKQVIAALEEGLGNEPIYLPPTRFNNKILPPGSFELTHDYLKKHGNSYDCKEVYNIDPNCNVSMKLIQARRRSLLSWRRRSGSLGRGRKLGVVGENGSSDEEKYRGVPFEKEGFTLIVWGMRKGHGSIMAIIVFLVIPINLFMTRYYKESFMGQRVLLTRIWYQVHVHGVFLTAALLTASLIIAIVARNYLGVSLTSAGGFHRKFGWITIAIFLLLAILGGFRAFDEPFRKISICLHWLIGTIFYLSMLILMANATFIPGSGASKRDQSILMVTKEYDQAYANGGFLHVIFWLVIELIMHALMMAHLCAFDLRMVVFETRMYLPVPIPVIKEHTSANADGHGLREIILIVYICTAVLSTVIYTIVVPLNTKWEGKGLGPMSCTHDPGTLDMYTNIHDDCIFN